MTTNLKVFAPVHPGEILSDEFLEPLGLSANRLAVAIGVPAPRIYDIVKGKRGITADTALRLSKFFGTSDRFWVNLQTRYDLEVTRDEISEDLEYIRPRDGGTDLEMEFSPGEIEGGYDAGMFAKTRDADTTLVGDFRGDPVLVRTFRLSEEGHALDASANDYSYAMAS